MSRLQVLPNSLYEQKSTIRMLSETEVYESCSTSPEKRGYLAMESKLALFQPSSDRFVERSCNALDMQI